MSTDFQLQCEICDVVGPDVHRSAGGGISLVDPEIGYTTMHQTWVENKAIREAGRAAWEEFLIEHEFHDIRLERRS